MTATAPAPCRVITLRTPLTDAARYAAAATPPAGRDTGCGICGVPHREPCQFVARHLEHMRMRGQSELTIRDRRNLLARVARQLPVPLLDAGHDDLMPWRESLTGRRLADATIASAVASLRVFYTWAIGEEVITGPGPAARIPVPGRSRMLPRPITEQDLATALAAAPPRIRLWLILAAWCGLRAKEVALLRRESVLDTAEQPVLIVAVNATKGRHRERVIPLSEFVLAELRAAGLPRSGWMFLRRDGQPGPNTPAMVSELANEHLHECGLAVTFHSLRHRFGSQAYQASLDLRAVQELMGHASPQQTAGYAAFASSAAAATVAALPVPGAGAPPPRPEPERRRSRALPAPQPVTPPQRPRTAYEDIAAELAAPGARRPS
jgi:integrase/recombinase XerC